jgi:hypothetical protein
MIIDIHLLGSTLKKLDLVNELDQVGDVSSAHFKKDTKPFKWAGPIVMTS